MLQTLLAERFKLNAHVETRKAPVYALKLARSDGRFGSKLSKSAFDCEGAGTPPNPKDCQSELGGQILGRGQRMSSLARMLSLVVGRPVIDRTGLTGGYDYELSFPELETYTNAAGRNSDPVNGIFSAIADQLGLRLENDQADLDFVIVDGVQHPTEN